MTRRRLNLLLALLVFALCGAGLWLFWLTSRLESRATALQIEGALEALLGGRCQVGPLSLGGVTRLGVQDLIVFRPDGQGELFRIGRADVRLAFPECLTGDVELVEVVLHAPVFQFDPSSTAALFTVAGGALRTREGGAQVVVRAGTLKWQPVAAAPDLTVTVGPVDMLLVPPRGEKAPVLRANTLVNGAPLELFGEYLTAPRRLRFTYFLKDLDVTALPGLGAALGLAWRPTGGRLSAEGDYVLTEQGREFRATVKLSGLALAAGDGQVATVEGALEVRPERVAPLGELSVTVPGLGALTLGGEARSPAAPVLDLVLKGKDLDAAALVAWLPPSARAALAGVAPTGRVGLDLRGRGPLLQPGLEWSGSVDLSGAGASVDALVAGRLDARATRLSFDEDKVALEGGLAKALGGTLAFSATMAPSEPGRPLSVTVRGSALDAAQVVAAVPALARVAALRPRGVVPLELDAAGPTAVATGSLDPRTWLRGARVTGRLGLAGVRLEPDAFSEPLQLSGSVEVEPDRARLFALRATGAGLVLAVDGDVRDPFGLAVVDATVTCSGRPGEGVPLDRLVAGALGAAAPGWKAALTATAGEASLSGTLRGPIAELRFFGEAPFERARLSVQAPGLAGPLELDLGRGRVAFDQEGLWSDPGTVGTTLGAFDYSFRVRWPAVGARQVRVELAPAAGAAPDLRAALALFAPERLPPPAAAARPGVRAVPDALGGAALSGRAVLDGDLDDPTLLLQAALGLPSGARVAVDGAVSKLGSGRYARFDVSVKGGEGLALSLAGALLPELRATALGPLLAAPPEAAPGEEPPATRGTVEGTLVVEGPAGNVRATGALQLDLERGQRWDVEVGGGPGSAQSFTATCQKGRLEALAPLLPWEPVRAVLAAAAPRLPFTGRVRWLRAEDGAERFDARVRLLPGAFDLPAGYGGPAAVNVIEGLVSLGTTRASTSPSSAVSLEASVSCKSPFADVDPAPMSLRVAGLRFADDDLRVDSLEVGLAGERLAVRGTVGKVSELGKLQLEVPRLAVPLKRLAAKLLPQGAGIDLGGTAEVGARISGTFKHPEVAGELVLRDVGMTSFYQKGLPLVFKEARATLTADDVLFTPFPMTLGVEQATFPADGSLKAALGISNVWAALVREPRGVWRRIVEYVGRLDTQKVISRAIGAGNYGTVLRAQAHRIKINIWTESRPEPYVYDAFLTDQESLEFSHRKDDVVRAYEGVAKRELAAREGFSAQGFGPEAWKLLRIKKLLSSVVDRDGNQVWPVEVPAWRLNDTPSPR